MNNQMESLKNIWQDSRNKDSGEQDDSGRIIALAKEKMKRAVRMQLATILILTFTLVILCVYFLYGVPLNVTISRIGAILMTAGLVLRILIEFYSIFLASRIDPGETVLKSTRAALSYHRFRKVINGPVTFIIILLYSVGFYMLTPEISLFFSMPVLILIDLSYIVIAMVIIGFVRRTIKKEMIILQEIVQVHHDLTDEAP
jgi:hypothetical protein